MAYKFPKRKKRKNKKYKGYTVHVKFIDGYGTSEYATNLKKALELYYKMKIEFVDIGASIALFYVNGHSWVKKGKISFCKSTNYELVPYKKIK